MESIPSVVHIKKKPRKLGGRSKGTGDHGPPGRGYGGDGCAGVGVGMLRGVRPRPPASESPRRRRDDGPGPGRKYRVGEFSEKNERSIEMTMPLSEGRFRRKVLASVGLDEGEVDYGEGRDLESHSLDKKESGRRRKDDVESPKASADEEEDASNVEEDEEYSEYEPFNTATEDHTRCESMKRIIGKLLWIMFAAAAIVYVFYDDEILEQSAVDENVTRKEPYSYNGYKDARIPDDDIAQNGGAAISAEAFGFEKDEGDHDESLQIYHESTGIIEVDSLWEQLSSYAEMMEPYDEQRDVPVFWHVPKCGGTTLQNLMIHCMGMVGANEIGAKYDTGHLGVVQLDNGNRYVTVDMSSPGGIDHAKDLGFGQSGLANVIMTSWFDQIASVFDDDHRGRCFTLLRHPIRRAVSMFYYLKDASWEHTYSEAYSNMTIEIYASSQYAEDNWMVRFLTDQMTGGVYDRHLDLAKEVLESKCLVGILEEFKESFRRFNKYFGWGGRDFGGPVKINDRGTCVSRVIGNPENAHSHPKYEEGSEVWNLLMEKNLLDTRLYEHALHLFHDVQGELFKEAQKNR